MPFQTLAIYRGSDNKYSGDYGYYILTTPDRFTADRLYRLIQDKGGVFKKNDIELSGLEHLSPQMWSWSGQSEKDLQELINGIDTGDTDISRDDRMEDVRHKIVFHRLKSNRDFDTHQAPPIIPHIDEADHVDGTMVFVRSKRHFDAFWYVNEHGTVVVDGYKRSRFQIKLATNEKKHSENKLMLPEDDVQIWLLLPSDEKLIKANGETGKLQIGQTKGRATFKFSTLIDCGFGREYANADDKMGYPVFVEDQKNTRGEQWQLT